jgi:thiol-disulfide isomerase/thioredoxin
MRRWMVALLAASIVALPLMALKNKADDESGKDRTTLFEDVQKDYQKADDDVRKALKAAKTPAERKPILEKYFDKLNQDFAPRVFKLIEAAPKDKLSFDMLMWVIQSLPDEDGKAFNLLAKHWAKSAKMEGVCQMLATDPQTGAVKLLQRVLEYNPSVDIRGLACYDLAQLAGTKANHKGDVAAQAEAEKLYEQIREEFAAVKLDDDTLGKKAKDALTEIRSRGIGKTAPNVASARLDGKKVQLKDYKGKVVVLDIWATWCPPCREMIPHERKMVDKFKGKPFALISISVDEEKDTLTDFLKETKMPWEHWWNGPSGGIIKDWDVHFFPTIYVLDAKGVIRYKHLRDKELEEAVEKLLAEAKQ